MRIKAISDNILCTDADFGDYVSDTGIIVKSNLEKSQGITARWFKIFECGPDVEKTIRERVGWWVLVEYGRWTEGFEITDDRFDTEYNTKEVWKVDPSACLALAETKENVLNYNRVTLAYEKMTL